MAFDDDKETWPDKAFANLIYAADYNALRDFIERLQDILGLGIKGGEADLNTRITNIETLKATITQLKAASMIGETNAAWVPCSFSGEFFSTTEHYVIYGTGRFSNTGATDFRTVYHLPLASQRGGKDLYIKGVSLGVVDADANNYIEHISLFLSAWDGTTEQYLNDTEWKTPQRIELAITPFKIDPYVLLSVTLKMIVDTAYALDFLMPQLHCYYA